MDEFKNRLLCTHVQYNRLHNESSFLQDQVLQLDCDSDIYNVRFVCAKEIACTGAVQHQETMQLHDNTIVYFLHTL